jgi:hypothetical protein
MISLRIGMSKSFWDEAFRKNLALAYVAQKTNLRNDLFLCIASWVSAKWDAETIVFSEQTPTMTMATSKPLETHKRCCWWFGTCFIFPYIGKNHTN